MPLADETPDPRPYLCIPYWDSLPDPSLGWDTGRHRDLPASVVSYQCPSIHAGAYTPGEPLHVTVDVRNSGGGSATSIATVLVYWADPTVGFLHPHFFAATTVRVPTSRIAPMTVTTDTMTATIPHDAPPHVCLIVSVSHPQDPFETICNPMKYRHWAQRNLIHAVAAQGAPVLIPFRAANPSRAAGAFTLRADPVGGPNSEAVAAQFGAQVSGVVVRMRFLDDAGAELSDESERPRASIALQPLEDRSLQLMVEVDQDISPGNAVPLEVILAEQGGDDAVVGSLGVVLLPPGL
jgi:hypothetical protein